MSPLTALALVTATAETAIAEDLRDAGAAPGVEVDLSTLPAAPIHSRAGTPGPDGVQPLVWNVRTRTIDRPAIADTGRSLVHGSQGVIEDLRPLGIVGANDTRQVDAWEWPYRASVRLALRFGAEWYSCTATLSGANSLLTAGHCVFDPETMAWADEAVAYFGYQDGEAIFGSATVTSMTTYNGWAYAASEDYDQAYLTLDRSMGLPLGWMGMAAPSDSVLGALTVEMTAYPGSPLGDLDTPLYGSSPVYALSDAYVWHTIDTAGGSSGGGLFSTFSGEAILVANHAHGWYVDANGYSPYNGGPRLTTTRIATAEEAAASGPAPVDLAELGDFGISELSTPRAVTGESIDVYAYLANVGVVTADEVELRWYLSEDAEPSPDDTVLGAALAESVVAFGSAEGDLSFDLPDEVRSGNYRVLQVIDPMDEVPEYDEESNIANLGRVTVSRDVDGDGEDDAAFGGSDCDDDDSSVNPRAEEVCGDGVDNDCDREDATCPAEPSDGSANDTPDEPVEGTTVEASCSTLGASGGPAWMLLLPLAARRRRD